MKRMNQLVDVFSCTPSFPPGGGPKLITITFSHFCEKARWALDLSPLASSYVEDCHPPALHFAPVMRAVRTAAKTRGEALPDGPLATSTPLLVYGDGTAVHDSSAILQHLALKYPHEMGHLYPQDDPAKLQEIKSVVADLDRRLGVASRLLAYYYGLQQHHLDEGLGKDDTLERAVGQAFGKHAPRIEDTIALRLVRWVSPILRQRLGISKTGSHKKALEDCRQVFKDMGQRLQDNGGVSVCGTPRMSAADLTFAALAYILVYPPQCQPMFVPLDGMPEPFQRIVHEFRDTPAGQHALQLYNTERYPPGHPRASSAHVCLRVCVDRDRIPWPLLVAAAAVVMALLRANGML